MLQRQVKADDLSGLIEMMTFLSQARARQEYTDDMAEPIKDTIEVLKSYGYEVPQSVYAMLDELPEQWLIVKKLAAKMKQHIAPLQANQVAHIRSLIIEMDRKQQELRDAFLREAPFQYHTDEPYAGERERWRSSIWTQGSILALDHWAAQLRTFDQEVQELTSLATTFDISIPEYKT